MKVELEVQFLRETRYGLGSKIVLLTSVIFRL